MDDGRNRGGAVLVVDDDEGVREYARILLERRGQCVLTAADGLEGLAVLRAHRAEIAAVLLDVVMPVMDGLTACREMHVACPEIRIVLMSGYYGADAAPQVEGAAAFLVKPFDRHALLRVLDLA